MKKILYIIISVLIVYGCGEFYGEYADGVAEFGEIVMLNRSSVPIKISVYGADWVDSEDTIYLKPQTGIWKIEERRDAYLENFHLTLLQFKVDFNNGERILCFDYFSDLPNNPCDDYVNQVWDEYKQHRILEFSDAINKEIFAKYNENSLLNMNLPYAPTAIDQELYTLGSTEAYFVRTYPVPEIREKLKIGAVVYGEAESLDKIRFNENYLYEPDQVNNSDCNYCYEIYHENTPYCYYNLSTLRNLGLNHYGCDFAALSGRYGNSLEDFCGIIKSKYSVRRIVSLNELNNTEEHERLVNDSDFPMYVVNNIIYGNMMFLLAEGNCSPKYLNNHLESHVWERNSFYDKFNTPEISYHLITLDENGEFTCESGGEEIAIKFKEGFSEPSLHPIYFTVTDFLDTEPLHIKGALY